MTREEILSTAKPILFNTDMARAILDGRKTATRRIMKNQDKYAFDYDYEYEYGELVAIDLLCDKEDDTPCYALVNKLPYKIGDILYVRETWTELETVYGVPYYAYKADDHILHHSAGENFKKWRPSIHMPKEVARIFLRVTDVRVERLQDIDGYGIFLEGVDNGKSNPTMGNRWENMQKTAYYELWNTTVKKSDLDKYGWDANPWVWVIEFEKWRLNNAKIH